MFSQAAFASGEVVVSTQALRVNAASSLDAIVNEFSMNAVGTVDVFAGEAFHLATQDINMTAYRNMNATVVGGMSVTTHSLMVESLNTVNVSANDVGLTALGVVDVYASNATVVRTTDLILDAGRAIDVLASSGVNVTTGMLDLNASTGVNVSTGFVNLNATSAIDLRGATTLRAQSGIVDVDGKY